MTRKHCPICNGKGKIPNPKGNGEAIWLLEINCPNCDGEGFIGVSDNLIKKSIFDKYKILKLHTK